MNTNQTVIELTDPKQIAYLIALKHRFINPPTRKGMLITFSFVRTPELQADIQNWEEGNTTVSLKKYAASLTHVRALIRHWSAMSREVGDE